MIIILSKFVCLYEVVYAILIENIENRNIYVLILFYYSFEKQCFIAQVNIYCIDLNVGNSINILKFDMFWLTAIQYIFCSLTRIAF